jgi:hypothetical protein
LREGSQVLKANDLAELSGDDATAPFIVTAKSGNGTWGGEVKMHVSGDGGTGTAGGTPGWGAHICTTINGLQLHGKITWAEGNNGGAATNIHWRPANNHTIVDDDDDDTGMDPDCVVWTAY